MGRGIVLTDVELAIRREHGSMSDDPFRGVNPPFVKYRETMFEKYKTSAPADENTKTYSARSARSAKAKSDDVVVNVQKFKDELRLNRGSNPTEGTEDKIILMPIEKHH